MLRDLPFKAYLAPAPVAGTVLRPSGSNLPIDMEIALPCGFDTFVLNQRACNDMKNVGATR